MQFTVYYTDEKIRAFLQGILLLAGTGNDLSRSLYWGGRYKDKPVKKVSLTQMFAL